MIDMRLRTKIAPEELELKVGKCLGPEDYNLVLTGPARIRKPDGRPLAVYLPGAMTEVLNVPGVYEILHAIEMPGRTTNRGLASGSPRFASKQKRTYARNVSSATVGAVDPQGQQRYCRLTAWTGQNMPAWETLHPVLREVAANLEKYVPERYAVQAAHAAKSDPAWVVPGTPFTTVTINNSYPTGTHQDKGDLDEGFSTICCLRRGGYTGGQLVFPEYRVAVDMQHGDLLLMDAHDWHGNVVLTCSCGKELNGHCKECGAERVSIVSYFRTKIAKCGSPEEEYQRANDHREKLAMKLAEEEEPAR
jgi:hypothetical protein